MTVSAAKGPAHYARDAPQSTGVPRLTPSVTTVAAPSGLGALERRGARFAEGQKAPQDAARLRPSSADRNTSRPARDRPRGGPEAPRSDGRPSPSGGRAIGRRPRTRSAPAGGPKSSTHTRPTTNADVVGSAGHGPSSHASHAGTLRPSPSSDTSSGSLSALRVARPVPPPRHPLRSTRRHVP